MHKSVYFLALICGLLLSGCKYGPMPALDTSPPPPVTTTLNSLPIKGKSAMTGYSREEFKHWIDADGDGCNTRAEILDDYGIDGTEVRDERSCVVGAEIKDPYSGDTITEVPGRISAVDIDHVVALGNAWITGGAQLSAAQRQELANDPENLRPTLDTLNQQKGDSDAASWLPPDNRCDYVTAQINVKAKYGLWVTQAEREMMLRILQNC